MFGFRNPYVDEHGYDTAYYIFHELYQCRIPLIQMRSVEEIREYGMPSIGDPQLDRQMANEIQSIQIPIVKIYEYWNQGADIRIAQAKDTERIYKRISNHLHDWKHYISSKLNTGKAPIEDLVNLDRFANTIYEHAKFHMDTEFLEIHFSQKLAPLQQSMISIAAGFEEGTFAKQKQVVDAETEEDVHSRYPRRESLAESFASRLTLSSLNKNRQINGGDLNEPSSIKSFADNLFGGGNF